MNNFQSQINVKPLNSSEPQVLLSLLKKLRHNVDVEGKTIFEQWKSHTKRPEFLFSALNLAQYLALRHYDLRPLQEALMPWGLSSLGRMEARVMPNLDAVITTLEIICGVKPPQKESPTLNSFFEGDRILQKHTEELFGKSLSHRRVKIMVTLPTEAGTNYELVREMIRRGANSLRINCAHDNIDIWQSMIDHVHRAEEEIKTRCRIMMDLSGPKIRTGTVLAPMNKKRLFRGDLIVLSRTLPSLGKNISQGKKAIPSPVDHFQTCCTVAEVLDLLKVDTPVYIDDGKIRTRVVDTQYPLVNGTTGLLLEVTHAKPKGVKLRSEKGLNFPDTLIPLNPLTDKDLDDLDFVATHADMIGYSFVQQPKNIELLQQELDHRLDDRVTRPAIIAKIETSIAVSNLPELIVQAAGKQPFGVMIARGDLAVEIGYQRLAEIQEEILWLCEAAHVPVIWATQVLENLVKDGAPSRGEMTDAAMAERAECVMLNKGPFIAEAITILDDVLTRMQAHQTKKTPKLRALHSW